MLYLSSSTSQLIDILAKRLSQKKSEPLSESWILLPSQINKQWLLGALAERMPDRALAGYRIASWREWLLFLARQKGVFVPGDLELRCAIAELLQDRSIDSLQPLFDWIAASENERQRIAELSRILSCELIEAGFFGFEPLKEWQKALYERIQSRDRWNFPCEVLQEGFSIPLSLRVDCFCIDEMPTYAWNILLSNPKSVSIYHFSPCKMFWEDLFSDRDRQRLLRKYGVSSPKSIEELESYLKDTHPLLANWGRLGRKTLRILEDEELLERQEAYESIERDSLLHCLQDDLLSLRTIEEGSEIDNRSKDDSLLIVGAGASRLREVQILKENLLNLAAKKEIPFSEIAVFAPDIKLYEPLIRFVFDTEIPVRIAPISALSSNKLLLGLLLFFEMLDESWDADRFFELLENRSFQIKQGIEMQDLNQWRAWLEDAKIRGGWDGKKGNWTDGIHQLLFSLVHLFPEEQNEQIRGLDWSSAEGLDRLLQIIELLRLASLKISEKQELSLNGWANLLFEIASELFCLEKDALFIPFLQKLQSASAHFADKPISFDLIFSLFKDLCANCSSSFQSHLWQGVQFSCLQAGAIRPARAIFLLGMNDEHFPRRKSTSSFDTKQKHAESRDVDRYLMLQAIFAAKDHLTMSYLHLSEEDGKPIDAALPIQELLQALDGFYRIEGALPSSSLFIEHPALEWDERYFMQDAPYPSFTERAFRAALNKNSAKPAAFWPTIQLKETERRFKLSDLQLLGSNPWKFFLKRSLGIYLKQEPLFSELRMEEFELPSYLKKEWLKQAMQTSMQEVLERNQKRLPPGFFGSYQKAMLFSEEKRQKSVLEKWGINPKEIHSIRFSPRGGKKSAQKNPRIDDTWFGESLIVQEPPLSVLGAKEVSLEVVGELSCVVSDGLVIDSSDSSLLAALRNWPSLLLYLLYTDKKEVTVYNLRKESKTSYSIDARAAWSRYVNYYERSCKSLSPLIAPWAESFLCKTFEEWKKNAQKTLSTALFDRSIRWILEKNTHLNYESIWHEWREDLLHTFQEIV